MMRYIIIALATMLVSSIAFSSVTAQEQSREAAVMQRLDEMLERLQAIEVRLAKLEHESRDASKWWRVDKRGVIRTDNGRPIGFWGIDSRPATQVR